MIRRCVGVAGRRMFSESAAKSVEVPLKLFGIHARYATAAFVAASKAKVLPQVEMEMLAFKDNLQKSKELANYVENPTISREAKISAMEALAGDNFSHITKNTLVTLAANARLAQVDKVIDAFSSLMKAHRKEVDAVITSAEPLTKAQTRAISSALTPHIKQGEKVVLSTKVDPSILGGLTILIGDKFLDLSAAAKIAALQRAI